MGAPVAEVPVGDADGIAGVEAVGVPVAVLVGAVEPDGVAVVAGVETGVVEAVPVAVVDTLGVAVVDTVADAALVAADVGVEASTSLVIAALHITSAPPPLPEPLH
jgi:hypothetical protein